ncbi:hypothetical protein yc1106_01950 [Curvularia clavata]|uniref:4'-phosphopantetheinyl transferase domain-containing protein n=1 Tax=Curvularia clavata TaxID=95742 RepID=A0A9Q9DQT6_CURCL|nr:hypothetical protein yc1106_01950 [Curvularia clavata]
MPPRAFPFPFRVGTDICSVSRIQGVITRRNDGDALRPLRQFLKRILTDHEQQYFWQRFAPAEDILTKTDAVSAFLAGRFAAKEACRKACDHLHKDTRGFQHIMILPVTSLDRSEHQSSRPQGLILDKVYEAQMRSKANSTNPGNVGVEGDTHAVPLLDVRELDGQLCEISISHDGDFATAVAIVPSMKVDGIILFEDAKRTEAFTRLAQAPSEGVSALGTVLQTPRAWWAILYDLLFKRKSIGKTSWCLICCALINIMALFAISPLSSALLTSAEVTISRPSDFSRIVPRASAELPIVANRETYFRTMAALMRNVSTSTWISDTSLTLPFWPSTEVAQFGPGLNSRYNSWAAKTTVLHADLDCRNMTLESDDLRPTPYSAYDQMGHGPYKGTEPMVHFVLKSDDGCNYNMSFHPSAGQISAGGLTWSNTSTLFVQKKATLLLGRKPFPAEVGKTSPYARYSASDECANRDIVILSTPWAKDLQFNTSFGPGIEHNRTFERSPEFRMKALLWRPPNITSNYVAKDNRTSIPKGLVDVLKFEKMALQNTWADYFNAESMQTDASRGLDDSQGPSADLTRVRSAPVFTGVGPLLGALYSFNIPRMLNEKGLAAQVERVKGRFFTECLREALRDPAVVETDIIKGETTMIEERIMVLREIGIALAVLFLVSSMLLIIVFWVSRLAFRPLHLSTDPGSAIGHAMLIRSQSTNSSVFRKNHTASREELHRILKNDKFYMENGELRTTSSVSRSMTVSTTSYKFKRWQPTALRLRTLFALFGFLACVLIAVMVLNAFSTQSRLSQQAFIYEADISKLGLSFSTFAPISIAPTVISIIIGLWWDQLDSTFRILQPYIAMSRGPTPIRNGAGLTYRSKTWIGAAIKAASNKHWILFMVALGSVLCQILTVSMSAIFERQSTNVVQPVRFSRTLEERTLPIVTTHRAATDIWSGAKPDLLPWKVLNELLLNPPENWLPGAAIQLSLNGTKPAWTNDDWSFIPVDLSHADESAPTQSKESILHPSNVTITTPALRAKLECDEIPEVMTASAWLATTDSLPSSYYEEVNIEPSKNGYILPSIMFNNTSSNTSTFATSSMIRCCSNTTNNDTNTAVIGYWSPVEVQSFPYADRQWPLPFVTKWIVGKPQGGDEEDDALIFKEAPALQAARCTPTIEAANAKVTVDKNTGTVHSFEIMDAIRPAQEAWSEVFVQRNFSDQHTTQQFNSTYKGPVNMTTSYGVLFMGSIFKAASDKVTLWEYLQDNAFVLRDIGNGINMDLMTYSMYNLANRDPQALLDYKTLAANAGKTFETFFQHFVSNGLSLETGGLAYQKIDDHSMDDLGSPIAWNGTALPQRNYASQNTNRTAEAQVSNRIQVLHMNTVATYLTVSIIVWLIATTVVISFLQRKYTSTLVRDIQLIADVLVLLAGSDNLLELLQERGFEVKKAEDISTMLGWFKDRSGEVRWGVEVVGGRNAVEWVEAPKVGNLVAEKGTSRKIWLPWGRNRTA